ncbi:hypothetical protein PoB_001793300 [Plakobranchus ocellatus]|uniref:Uncharacterized protein n=1 Tax=Plakobranchus ocellatus TaxID=259542 RepID=A0AAV3Z9I6_9GAST|nr:hypothetical protein PoB_001793300 [Plakobranchus ocellatus]
MKFHCHHQPQHQHINSVIIVISSSSRTAAIAAIAAAAITAAVAAITWSPKLFPVSAEPDRISLQGKIAALKSKDRLRQKMKRQQKSLCRGLWHETEVNQIPLMSPLQMKALLTIWDEVVKFIHISGINLLNS